MNRLRMSLQCNQVGALHVVQFHLDKETCLGRQILASAYQILLRLDWGSKKIFCVSQC